MLANILQSDSHLPNNRASLPPSTTTTTTTTTTSPIHGTVDVQKPKDKGSLPKITLVPASIPSTTTNTTTLTTTTIPTTTTTTTGKSSPRSSSPTTNPPPHPLPTTTGNAQSTVTYGALPGLKTKSKEKGDKEGPVPGWYFPGMTRAEAEEAMSRAGEDTFLIRISSVQNCYALSVCQKKQGFVHFIIVEHKASFILKDCLQDKNTYSSLEDLLLKTPVLLHCKPLGDVLKL
jgi:hypothetical protein